MNIKYFLSSLRSYVSRPRMQVQMYMGIEDPKENVKARIIFCPHRSGSSLFRRIINSHSRMYCPPETFFFKEYIDLVSSEKYKKGYQGLVAKDDVERHVYIQMSELHRKSALANGKDQWFDKTPENIWICDELKRIMPEDSKFIVLQRNPLDVYNSIYQRKWVLEGMRNCNYPYERQLMEYIKDIYSILSKISEWENSITINYEELCENPEITMRNICSFLEVDFEFDMLDYSSKEHNFGTEDPMVRGTKAIKLSPNDAQQLPKAIRHELEHEFESILNNNKWWNK